MEVFPPVLRGLHIKVEPESQGDNFTRPSMFSKVTFRFRPITDPLHIKSN